MNSRQPRERAALSPVEAAFVLERSESEVRRMLRRGALEPIWSGRRLTVDVAELGRALGERRLARAVLRGLVEGSVVAPNVEGRTRRPPPLVSVAGALFARAGGVRWLAGRRRRAPSNPHAVERPAG